MNAYRFGQLSNIYPIARGLSPLLLMLATLIIGLDYISGGQILGIIIISLSMIYIGATQYRFDKDGPKGLLLAVITGCFIASYSLMDAVGGADCWAGDGILWWGYNNQCDFNVNL